jgi:hypothetical protein
MSIVKNHRLINVSVTNPLYPTRPSTVSKTLDVGSGTPNRAKYDYYKPSGSLALPEDGAVTCNHIGDLMDICRQLDALIETAADFRRKIVDVGAGDEVILEFEK